MRRSRNFVRGDPGQSFSQMVNFEENYHFSRFRGVQHFPGGGVQLFPIETNITCDYPEGVGTPCPPLSIRTWDTKQCCIFSKLKINKKL